jgi:hypothetical protein
MSAVPDVTELFAPPDDIQKVLARPLEDWAKEDYERIFAWLYERPRRTYLREIATRRLTAIGAMSAERTEALVEEFYSRRVGRLLRQARFRNVGALLLVEFDKFLSNAFKRLDYYLEAPELGVLRPEDPISIANRKLLEPSASRSSSGTTSPMYSGPYSGRRLSPRDRRLLEWASSEPPSTRHEEGEGDWVETTVFGPRKVAQGRHFLLQAFTHTPDQAAEAQRLAIQFDPEATEKFGNRTLGVKLLPGMRLTFTLVLPGGLSVIEPVQEMVWTRKTEGIAFGVEVSLDRRVGSVIGTVTVAVDSVPVGRLTIRLEIKPSGQAKSAKMDALDGVTTDARRYERSFISYASQDRNKVLERVQVLDAAHIPYFQDLLHLDPGERWARELYRQIDRCDLFLLFWSSHAKASEWVMKEVNYAITLQAGDPDAPPDIHPIIIEGPPPVPPPPELAHLHFNDRLIYFMQPDTPQA